MSGKMEGLTIEKIAEACRGTFYGDQKILQKEVNGVVIDSRQVEEGYLYIPVVGEKVDGHSFIESAFEKGAICTLSERKLETNHPYILVESSLDALKQIAAYYRESLKIKVIGITGSVGKTSTKETISAVLSQKYQVLKTEGNFNNEIGVPLTLLKIRKEHCIAIIEMGIDSFGEMHRLSEMVKPNVVVMTNIGTCHLNNLKDRDGVLRAKSEIFDFISNDGAIVLNGDDDKLAIITQIKGIQPQFFGIHSKRKIYADQIENKGMEGMQAVLHYNEEEQRVTIPVPGEHMVYNALAGLAVGRQFGLSMKEIADGIATLKTISGRNHKIDTENYHIIDDCYNANPMSMKASLDVLKNARGRRVAILGDMFELGENEVLLHREIGKRAAENKIDVILCVGELSRNIFEAAKEEGGNALYYETKEEMIKEFPNLLQKGDTILVKASHGMEFSKVVKILEEQ